MNISDKILRQEFTRGLIGHFVNDLITHSQKNIQKFNPKTPQDIHNLNQAIISFSPEVEAQKYEIKAYLMKKMYQHHKIQQKMQYAQHIIHDLWNIYMADPCELPKHIFKQINNKNDTEKAIIISDFIAGMTDKFAIEKWEEIL